MPRTTLPADFTFSASARTATSTRWPAGSSPITSDRPGSSTKNVPGPTAARLPTWASGAPSTNTMSGSPAIGDVAFTRVGSRPSSVKGEVKSACTQVPSAAVHPSTSSLPDIQTTSPGADWMVSRRVAGTSTVSR
jgi:hypothetical protein